MAMIIANIITIANFLLFVALFNVFVKASIHVIPLIFNKLDPVFGIYNVCDVECVVGLNL